MFKNEHEYETHVQSDHYHNENPANPNEQQTCHMTDINHIPHRNEACENYDHIYFKTQLPKCLHQKKYLDHIT